MKKEEELGLAIAQRREYLGISQMALAKEIGVSRPYISQIETGKKTASTQTIIKILVALGVTIESTLDMIFHQDEFCADDDLGVYRNPKIFDDDNKPTGMDEYMRCSASALEDKVLDLLSNDQVLEMSDIFDEFRNRQNTAITYLNNKPLPAGPDGWANLPKEDKRLVQRLVNRLLAVDENESQ